MRKRLCNIWGLPAVLIAAIVVLPVGFGCGPSNQADCRLAVVVVVDQMRPDCLERFDHLYTGGLRRLLDGGVLFTDVYHDYAITETAVGHATIATGTIPAHHGIMGNDWYDHELCRDVYSCEDTAAPVIGRPDAEGRSPRRLAMPTVGDWLKKRSPESKVAAVALKDRVAILMAGHFADAAYWYDRNRGVFTTSAYYAAASPDWIDSFNASEAVGRFLETGWSKLLADSVYALSGADSVPDEHDGSHVAFPHRFDTAGVGMAGYYSELRSTPFGDQLTFELARQCVTHLGLGEDGSPDLLWIGCSAADGIGERYGPNSHEIQDYFLRLDRYLDDFLVFLDGTIGRENYVLVFAADHGVMPMPHELKSRGIESGRFALDSVDAATYRVLRIATDKLGLPAEAAIISATGVAINDSLAGESAVALESEIAARMRELPFIADAYTAAELADSATPERPYLDLYRNNYHPMRGAQVSLRYPENWLVTSRPFGTCHGSPYRYDTQVPLVLFAPGLQPARCEDSVRSADIAPTLFELLGYEPPEAIDGRSLIPRLNR